MSSVLRRWLEMPSASPEDDGDKRRSATYEGFRPDIVAAVVWIGREKEKDQSKN